MSNKPVPKFSARIKNGKVVLDSAMNYDRYCKANFKEGDNLDIVIRKRRKIRSSGQPGEKGNQNGWYWGVVLPLISESKGHTPDELDKIYLDMFAPKKRYTMKSGKVATVSTGTSEMDTLEFSQFIERIRAEVGWEGIIIPDPVKVDV